VKNKAMKKKESARKAKEETQTKKRKGSKAKDEVAK